MLGLHHFTRYAGVWATKGEVAVTCRRAARTSDSRHHSHQSKRKQRLSILSSQTFTAYVFRPFKSKFGTAKFGAFSAHFHELRFTYPEFADGVHAFIN